LLGRRHEEPIWKLLGYRTVRRYTRIHAPQGTDDSVAGIPRREIRLGSIWQGQCRRRRSSPACRSRRTGSEWDPIDRRWNRLEHRC
jgi:hypothetical protein